MMSVQIDKENVNNNNNQLVTFNDAPSGVGEKKIKMVITLSHPLSTKDIKKQTQNFEMV